MRSYSRLLALAIQGAVADHRGQHCLAGRGVPRPGARRPAVLPAVRPQRADRRLPAAPLEFDLRQRSGRRADRGLAGRKRGCRLLELLCRPQCDPLLPAARHPSAEQPSLADRRHGEGYRRTRAAGGGTGQVPRRNVSRRPSAASARWKWVRRSAGRCNGA